MNHRYDFIHLAVFTYTVRGRNDSAYIHDMTPEKRWERNHLYDNQFSTSKTNGTNAVVARRKTYFINHAERIYRGPQKRSQLIFVCKFVKSERILMQVSLLDLKISGVATLPCENPC